MRNAFLRWLLGVPPAIVGGGWHDDAICLVRIERGLDGKMQIDCVYDVLPVDVRSVGDSQDVSRANTLKSLMERWGNTPKRLALGIPAGDVFIKAIDVPSGLTEPELVQLSVVEAVANLPVPPEEVCADYLHVASGVNHGQGTEQRTGYEKIRIAFCRRDVVDELSLLAEDAGVQLAAIDRDIQALHDAALWLITVDGMMVRPSYPLLLLWATEPLILIIARDALDLTQYALKTTDLLEQFDASCRRAGITDAPDLLDVWVFQGPHVDENLMRTLASRLGAAHMLNPQELLHINPMPPLIPLMTGLGMALRENA